MDKNDMDALDAFEKMASSEVKTPHYRSIASNVEGDVEDEAEETEREEDEVSKRLLERDVKPLSNAMIWKRVLRGDLLNSQIVRSQFKLFLLILCGFIIIVAMRYKVESLQKEKIAIEERIGSLREHKIQMQKHYQESVKISNIAEQLDSLGVGLISGPPYAIEY